MKNLDSNGLGYLWYKIKNKFLTKSQYEKDNQYRAHVVIPQHESVNDEYYLLATLLPNASSNGGQIHVNAIVGGFHSYTKATIDFSLTSRSYDYNTDFTLEKDLKGFYYGKVKAFEFADFYITKLDDGYFNLYLVLKAGKWVCPIQMNYEFYYRGGPYLHDIIYHPTANDKSSTYEGELVGVASEVLINYETEINQIKVRTSVPVGGSIVWYGTEDTIPSDYMREDGRSLNKNDYPLLFSRLGYAYGGEGDNFNIPNSKGKVIVHLNESDIEFNTRGKSYGTKTHALTIEQLAKHSHTRGTQNITGSFIIRNCQGGNTVNSKDGVVNGYQGALGISESTTTFNNLISMVSNTSSKVNQEVHLDASKNWTGSSSEVGESEGHNNIQPSLTAFRIIKVREDVSTGDIIDLDAKVRQLETIVNKLNNNLGDLEVEIIDEWDD